MWLNMFLGLFDAWFGKLGIIAFLSKNLVKHYFYLFTLNSYQRII